MLRARIWNNNNNIMYTPLLYRSTSGHILWESEPHYADVARPVCTLGYYWVKLMFIVVYTHIAAAVAAADNNNNINDSSGTDTNKIIKARVIHQPVWWQRQLLCVRAITKLGKRVLKRSKDFFYSRTKFRQNLLSARLQSELQTRDLLSWYIRARLCSRIVQFVGR